MELLSQQIVSTVRDFGLSQPNVPAVAGRGGSGMTCWRRLRDWQQDGIWDLIHFALLDCLSRDGQIDCSRAVVDSCRYARVRTVLVNSRIVGKQEVIRFLPVCPSSSRNRRQVPAELPIFPHSDFEPALADGDDQDRNRESILAVTFSGCEFC